ncbi:MAG TPA: 4Fe-4S dicluster domain-containing protein [Candidatus Methanofastidiosa archaeon]|nr:4Fe-4S dicluster domain-containing protein [Candidatus Methanofastidiosa archaeon]HPR42256.1 4Fe-4S dicluster domain-containing protein [Candidatus Methanofastidiosa archaeon]
MGKSVKEILMDGNGYACIQCGRCTGSCPSGRECSLRTRKLIHMARIGMDVIKEDELWDCTTCFTCQERCPKEVKTTDMIIELRNLAVEEGYLPTMADVPKIIIKSLYDTGAGQPLSPEISKVRSIIGLKKEAYDVSTNEETLKKFQRLLDGLEITRKGGLR